MTDLPDNVRVKSGRLLRDVRERIGWTQQDVAGELGYSRPVITNAERGHEISGLLIDAYRAHFPDHVDLLDQVEPTATRKRVEPLAGSALDEMFRRRSSKTTDLNGEWFALWEATVDGREVLNMEKLDFKMMRDGSLLVQNVEVSNENPDGGYLWIAHARLFDNQYLIGTYIPREVNVRSKGCLYLVLHQSGRFIEGQWIGCSYDGDWSRGLVVMARSDDRLHDLLQQHRKQIPTMPYTN